MSQCLDTVHFLEIGAMDGSSFDLLYPFIHQYRWQGLLVEPLPDLFQELKAAYAGCEGLVFENVAITNAVEDRSIFRVPRNVIQKGEVPKWAKGIASLYSDRNALGGHNGLAHGRALDARVFSDLKNHIVAEPVSCVPLDSLIEKHDIQCVDVLQIDTEGFDFQVLRQFNFSKFDPLFIKVEIWNLVPDEYVEVKKILTQNKYRFSEIGMDIVAWR